MPVDPSVERTAALFTSLPIIWGFCGGWALDLFLNHTTRPHKDVDIAILRGDQRAVFDFLRQRDWTLEQAVDGKLLPLHKDEFLLLPIHTIWCRNAQARPDFLEVLLNESEGNQFLFRRDPSIRHLLNEAFMLSPSGFPILAPEIALLYKAGHPQRAENALDFQSVLPELNIQRRQWLRAALNQLYPEHEWLKVLR